MSDSHLTDCGPSRLGINFACPPMRGLGGSKCMSGRNIMRTESRRYYRKGESAGGSLHLGADALAGGLL